MREHLNTILNNYLREKRNEFANNDLAALFKGKLVIDFHRATVAPDDYRIIGSAGKGNWAEIPWIGVFDQDITHSAQTGYYIVYLFKADMQGVYLSLNQGWTQFKNRFGTKEAKAHIKVNTKRIKELLHTVHMDFSFDSIDLLTSSNHDLGIGYVLGHICGKFYPKDNLPDDRQLISDLWKMIGVYRELKGIIGKDVFVDLSREESKLFNPKPQIAINRRFSSLECEDDINKELSKIEIELKQMKPQKQSRLVQALERNRKVAALIKKKYNYQCQICGYPGFEQRDGKLYAEAHHKEALCDLGRDIPSNMICVCPMCHAVLHYGTKEALNSRTMVLVKT